MRKKSWFLALWVVFSTQFCAAISESDEIVIQLNAPNQLTLIHSEHIRLESEKISESHANSLERVMLFDLNHNGKMRTLKSDELKQIGEKPNNTQWRSKGVAYILTTWIRDQYLTFSLLSTAQDKVCFATEMKLTGKLDLDRAELHKAISQLHESLFCEPGIYTNKILYAYKVQNMADPYYASVPEEIYECDFDGANPKQLTFENSHCISPYPTLGMGSKEPGGFFYVSYKIGQPKIFWKKYGEGRDERLCYIPGNQFMPCMSPQGDKVVFINDAPGHPEVFMQTFKPGVGPMGKPRQIYSCRKGVQASPVFSPEGDRIAFVSDQSGSPRIYVMDIPLLGATAKSLQPMLITKLNRENTKPSWSPDGTKLAYISRVDGVRQVWIYDFTTNQEWQLTHGNTNKENPQWASNSLHLVFNSVGNDSCELYLVNLNQPKAVRLRTEPGIKRFPVWVRN